MKKILTFLSIALFSLLTFSGCNDLISNGDTTYVNAPTVDTFSSGFSISVTYRSTHTDFIYIFRKNLTDKTDPVCIGFVSQPVFLPNTVYQFEDSCVNTEKKYAYCAVYHDSVYDVYNATSWTATAEADGKQPRAGNGEKTDVYTSLGTVIYNPISEELTFEHIPSNGDFDHALKISLLEDETEEIIKTKVFSLADASDEDLNNYTVKLRNIVSEDFLQGYFRIDAILGDREELSSPEDPDEIPQIKRAVWTTPYSLKGKILNTSGTTIDSITLETFNYDGYVVPEL